MPALKGLLTGLEAIQITGSPDVDVHGLTFDSRKAAPGMAFFAIRGVQADGHDFIPQAVAAGAAVVICEKMPAATAATTTFVQVADAARAMGLVAAAFYDHPSRKLKLVGITGTNGKTTCVTLLHKLFRELGYHVGLLSTV